MAAPELSGRSPRRTSVRWLAVRGWLAWYLAVWACTLTTAAVVLLAGEQGAVRRLLPLSLTAAGNRTPSAGRVLGLTAHNLPLAAWPLLLGLTSAQAHGSARRLASALVSACMLANTVLVGAALGGYGVALLAFLPQLPVEWAALALGYCSWAVQARVELGLSERLRWLAAIALLIAAAAALETVAVPHR
jgi:hypothetical protein